MRVAFAVLLAAFSCLAHAGERSYAVLSFVGDRLLVTQYVGKTGSNLDRNPRQYLDLASDVLDRTALREVRTQVDAIQPGAHIELLAATDKGLRDAARAAVERADVSPLVAALRPELKGIDVTHWILVTKARAEVRAPIREGTIGTGQVDGLGFYIDRWRSLQVVETGEITEGFLTPFAYLRVSLVEASTGKVVREEQALMSTTHTRQSATHPWDALDAEAKVAMLERLLRQGIGQAMPRLLAP